MDDRNYVISGTIVHSTEEDPMVVMENHVMGVKGGVIVFVEERSKLDEKLKEHGLDRETVLELEDGQFVLPGFIDTHIHASQYPNAGKGLDLGLLDWLNRYTFPVETRYSDLQFAKDSYEKIVKRTLRCGTTTACYYATIDTDASLVLCDVIANYGQRAFVGKVNMNQNSPDFYIETSVETSVKETRRFVETVLQRKYENISPIVTPRFAISCCDKLMKQLGDIAAEYNIPIQTHICETRDEIQFVHDLFPQNTSYTDVYDQAGLVTDKTVLAHGIYLTDSEIKTIKSREAAVSHCPNSNLSIRSGLCDVKNLLKHGIKVGLGTDVSGGYHPSICDAMRTAVQTSNVLAIQSTNGYKPLSVREAFRLATLGGAKALSIDHKTGNFTVGKELDCLIIDPGVQGSAIDSNPDDTVTDQIEKFFFLGDDRNIVSMYVAGKNVKLT